MPNDQDRLLKDFHEQVIEITAVVDALQKNEKSVMERRGKVKFWIVMICICLILFGFIRLVIFEEKRAYETEHCALSLPTTWSYGSSMRYVSKEYEVSIPGAVQSRFNPVSDPLYHEPVDRIKFKGNKGNLINVSIQYQTQGDPLEVIGTPRFDIYLVEPNGNILASNNDNNYISGSYQYNFNIPVTELQCNGTYLIYVVGIFYEETEDYTLNVSKN